MRRGRGRRLVEGNGFDEGGGYMAVKKQKLQNQFSDDIQREQDNSSTASGIFEGVTIHVNGYTVPSSDELKRLMQLHGGAFQHYYGKTRVSHIIATMLPHTKLKKLTNEKVVRPEWILDSIKAGELLPCEEYQLYSHRLTAQKTLQFSSTKASERSADAHPAQQSSTKASNGRSLGNSSANNVANASETSKATENPVDVHTVQLSSTKSNNGQSLANSRNSTSTSSANHETNSSISNQVNTNEQSRLPPSDSSHFKTPQGSNSHPTKQTITSPHQQHTTPKSSRTTATAGDSNFVSEFYNNSRLHHISTWGAEFKAYVSSLQNKANASFPGRERLKDLKSSQSEESLFGSALEAARGPVGRQSSHVIMHVDMDCFFVSVGLIDRPDLLGKPVAVTHSKGKGMPVVNQEARQYERKYYENRGKSRKEQSKSMNISNLFKSGSDSSVGSSVGDSDNKAAERDMVSERQSRVEQVGDSELQSRLSDASSDITIPSNSCNKDDREISSATSTTKSPPTTLKTSPSSTSNSSKQSSKESFSSMAEIASCSYEARKAGIKNGMFMGRAKQLCPDLQMIPYDFDGYKRVSQALYETVASYTHDIEAVSCDEMLVDITSVLEDTGVTPLEFAGILREEIKEKTKCAASAGIAANILLARMSTRVAKPDGQFYLEPDAVQEFIKKQPVKDLPGVGWSTSRRLQAMGLITCQDLQKLTIGVLQKEFGPKTGQSLYQYCRGIDDRPIKGQHVRKSVSAEINYGIRFKEDTEAVNFVTELAGEVHKRLQAINMLGKVITFKLKVRQEGAPKETSKFLGHGVVDNVSKSVNLPIATESLDVIRSESVKLLKQVKVAAVDMRGVGIQISRLTSKSASSTKAASTGSKSLLDFIERGQNSKSDVISSSSSTSSNDTVAVATKKAKLHKTTMLDFVAKQQPQSEISELNSENDQSLSGDDDFVTPARTKKLPPLPVLPDFKTPSESGTPVARVVKQAEEFSFPTPSQLDNSVLSALPEDIRCEILAKYKSADVKKLTHTRGSSPSIDEPSTSTGITRRPKRPVQQRQQDQWDPQVLAELPEDILAEIMEGRDQETREQEVLVEEPQVETDNIEALPNISQIDPSCLEALPPELQKELQAAYKRQNKTTNPPKTTPKKSNQATTSSPKPPSKTSPFAIKRRRGPGRPRKTSPQKKVLRKDPNQPGILDMFGGNAKPSPAKADIPEASLEESGGGEDVVIGQLDDAEEESETRAAYQPVNLCGAVQLQDVKKLLKEWMSAFPEPLDEDIHHIVEYLYQLILDRNLEMVDLVLRAVKRLSERCNIQAWLEAYSMMEGKIQDIIYDTYGSRLKMQTLTSK